MPEPQAIPSSTRLGPGAEFDRIRAIVARLGAAGQDLGDDGAIVPAAAGDLVVSTDVSVEGVHFRTDWLTLEEIGWRAAAAALSDLAAMGAAPAGLLTAVVVPRGAEGPDVTAVMQGVGDAGAAVDCPVLGGDLSAGERWHLTVTVLGWAERPVRRRGARPGDTLWVTGALGGARAALTEWQAGGIPEDGLRRRFARPEPRIRAGRWLAAHGATAMIDLSDGLAGDVRHLAAASAVRLEVNLASLPIEPSVHAVARRSGSTPARFAAMGGEDYELLVALPASFEEADALACQEATGVVLTAVGTITAGDGVRLLDGETPVALRGWEHFA